MNVQLNVTGVDWPLARYPKMEEILWAVVDHTGISAKQIQGRSRTRRVVAARFLAMAITRAETEESFEDIGAFYRRTHGAVIHACGQIHQASLKDPRIADAVAKITAALQ